MSDLDDAEMTGPLAGPKPIDPYEARFSAPRMDDSIETGKERKYFNHMVNIVCGIAFTIILFPPHIWLLPL